MTVGLGKKRKDETLEGSACWLKCMCVFDDVIYGIDESLNGMKLSKQGEWKFSTD